MHRAIYSYVDLLVSNSNMSVVVLLTKCLLCLTINIASYHLHSVTHASCYIATLIYLVTLWIIYLMQWLYKEAKGTLL